MLKRYGFLSAWALVFIGLLIWLGLLVVRLSAEIELYGQQLKDDRPWHISQLQIEMERLMGSLNLYVESPNEQNRQQSILYAEIFWSRAILLNEGDTGRYLRELDEMTFHQVTGVLIYMEQYEASILDMELEFARLLRGELAGWINDFQYRIVRLAEDAYREADARSDLVSNTYRNIRSVLLGLGFVGAVGFLVLLNSAYRNRLLRFEAERATRVQSEFLANMSHEMRTPLNGIIGTVDLLIDCDNEVERLSLVNTLSNSSEALLAQINDVLDYSRLESGLTAIEVTTFELLSLVRDTVAILQAQARSKGINLYFEPVTTRPVWVLADNARLRQILLNLIGNAIKFTNEGYVNVSLQVDIQQEATQVRIGVKDTGIGITSEQRKQLFLPFRQADNSTSRRYGGTGLGLAISQQLAELLGGRISVTSKVGKGSEFRLELTLNPARPLLNKTEPGASFQAETAQLTGSVLIAEDNAVNQSIVRKMLQKTGLETVIANNGQDVLRACEQQRFDLILMDVQMPVMDGLEATRQIRALGITTPVVALTANATAESRQACIEAGMVDFLSKPFRYPALQQILNRFLNSTDDQAAGETRP